MFKTNFEVKGDTAQVALIGDLDATASEQFVSDVQNCLKQNVNIVVLDMEKLEFISSSGLRKLLTISKMIVESGGSMSVRNVSANIMQIFSLTGFDSLLGIK